MSLVILWSQRAAEAVRALDASDKRRIKNFVAWLGADLHRALGDPRVRTWPDDPHVEPFRVISFLAWDIIYLVEKSTMLVADIVGVGSRPV